SEASQDHPVFRARCDSARLFVLLQARRFDALEAACMAMREGIAKGRHPRLAPWIQDALALREYLAFGHAGVALDSLRAIARQTPVCEAHARASLEAAWIHL